MKGPFTTVAPRAVKASTEASTASAVPRSKVTWLPVTAAPALGTSSRSNASSAWKPRATPPAARAMKMGLSTSGTRSKPKAAA